MIFNELQRRGFVKQTTNIDKIQHLLDKEEIVFYIGFDPTADSLHVGHLMQLVLAQHLINEGHHAVMLLGGATARIGDPTGKSDMRPELAIFEIAQNSDKICKQINKIVPRGINLVNNLLWFEKVNFMDFMQDVGRHFSVNNMLRAECFKTRMEHGLTFLEFSYMLMQSFDFLQLNNKFGCVLQIGGDDQWSNILGGIDLIHKRTGRESFGMTLPLLTNSSGQKMGKTEKGAIWLSSEKTKVFDFFQFWRNIPDSEVLKCLNLLTFIPLDKIESMPLSSPDNFNAAKKILAFEITKMVHGEEAATIALQQAEALFEKKDLSAIGFTPVADNTQILDLLVSCGFAKSRTAARNLIDGRGVVINDQVITNPLIHITKDQFGPNLIVKKGKKHLCLLTIVKEPLCLDQNL